jgi:glutathione reductase (NADPH)
MPHDVDLFVIGGGSGGVRAARMSARLGARVMLAEPGRLGGTCVNLGCIPKKLFSYASHYRDDLAEAAGFGWSIDAARFDWSTLRANVAREIGRLNGVYRDLLLQAGVEIRAARARVLGPHEVEVGGERVSARHILVATGGHPTRPDIPGAELACVSDDMFGLAALPGRAVVIGAGYIAVEFASILNGLGVETVLACRGARLLRAFDAETTARLADGMAGKGVRIRFGAAPREIRRREDGLLEVLFAKGEPARADLVLLATGRAPSTRDLGLEAAGVRLGATGGVLVDRHLRSSVESILAIGDVTDRLNLTPVATAEGMAVARTLFGGEAAAVDFENVPTAVFGDPNLASVGLSEDAARERHGAVDVYKASFRALRHTLGGSDERTFVKLVVERAGQRVVGAHMVGSDAGEIIQGVAIAVKLGATKSQFDATIGIHPTVAEEFVTLRERSS